MTKKHSPTQADGYKAEKMACDYLKMKGLRMVKKNYTTRCGEIDLIMEDRDTLVFIEVRQRKCTAQVSSAESVNRTKQKKIIRVALAYLLKYPTQKNCRFDVIAIKTFPHVTEIDWIKDAFQVQ